MYKVNTAGRVKMMCFDKTGTLTENNLIFAGIILIEDFKDDIYFTSVIPSLSKIKLQQYFRNTNWVRSYEVLSLCHSLTMFEQKLLGDPLEIEMFKQTESELIQNEQEILYERPM